MYDNQDVDKSQRYANSVHNKNSSFQKPWHIYICFIWLVMYVCVYVYIYIYIYICMCVCENVQI